MNWGDRLPGLRTLWVTLASIRLLRLEQLRRCGHHDNRALNARLMATLEHRLNTCPDKSSTGIHDDGFGSLARLLPGGHNLFQRPPEATTHPHLRLLGIVERIQRRLQ